VTRTATKDMHSAMLPPSVQTEPTEADRTEYLRTFQDRVAAMQSAVEAAWRTPMGAVNIAEARNEAHKMRVTAGCYGFPEVGRAAGVIEELLTQMSDDRRESSANGWSEIEAALAEATEAATRPADAPTVPPLSPPSTSYTERSRVLVVDEDPEFLRSVAETGAERLIDVVTATTPDEALEKAQRIRFDAALIDVLPGPDGLSFQLARRLTKLRGPELLPIAFVSDSRDIHQRIEATRVGTSLYLTKPMDASAITAALCHLTTIRKVGKPRVLIVDDDADAAHVVATLLRSAGMLVTIQVDSTLILDALEKSRPDLLLLDLSMPTVTGLDICRVLRQAPSWKDLAIVFLSGRADLRTRLQAFQAGADDFMEKCGPPEEIVARIRRAVDRATSFNEAFGKDGLTGLWLRTRFMEELSRRIREARRHERPLTLVLLDLDHFKAVNDTYGHLAGDHLLIGVAARLRRCFRSDDVLARWGGDEFMLALPGQTPENAASVLGRLRRELQLKGFEGDSTSLHVTFSAGTAGFPADGDSLDALIKAADRRLYTAKRAGRACAVVSG